MVHLLSARLVCKQNMVASVTAGGTNTSLIGIEYSLQLPGQIDPILSIPYVCRDHGSTLQTHTYTLPAYEDSAKC